MQLVSTIFFFIVFIVAYGVWTYFTVQLTERAKQPELANSHARLLLLQELYAVVSYGGFLIFVYLLTGFWNWTLVLGFVVIAQLGIVTTAVLWALVGSSEEKWHPRTLWAGFEFAVKHRIWALVTMGLGVLVFIGYPIIAGVAYFRYSASPQLTVMILQYTLVALFLSGLMTLPITTAIIASVNIDENTRTRFLISQLGALIPNAFILVLAFLAFGRDVFDLSHAVSVNLWIQVLAVLLVYFAVAAVAPYLIGTRLGRARRTTLINREKAWLSTLGDILAVPSSDRYAVALQGAHDDIKQELAKLWTDDMMFEIAEDIDIGNVPAEAAALAEYYRQTRDMDPRFRYLDGLRRLLEEIESLMAALEAKASDDEKIRVAQAWAGIFQRHEKKLDERQAHEESRSFVPQLAWSALGILLSAALSSIGKVLWEKMGASVF